MENLEFAEQCQGRYAPEIQLAEIAGYIFLYKREIRFSTECLTDVIMTIHPLAGKRDE